MLMVRLFLLAMIALAANSLKAQVPAAWNVRGAGAGGAMYAPAISPFNPQEYYFSSDMSELYHTADFGNSCSVLNFQQIQGGHFSVAQFTANSNILYNLTYTGGNNATPVKSTDGGQTWSALPGNPLPTDETYSLWADFNNPQRLVTAGWAAIYLSTNGGNSFTSVNVALTNGTGGLIGGAFFDANNIYLGTSEGLIVSTNNGATFFNAGTPGIPAGEYIRSFAGAKVGGTTRFFALTVAVTYAGQDVGADYWGNIRGIYSMDNATGPWLPRFGGVDTNSDFLMFIAMARNDINTVYAGGSKYTALGDVPGVMKTTDAGLTWTNIFLTTSNQNIITGWSGQGGDKNWGYGEVVFGLAVAPSNSASVVFTDMGFIHNSTNGGALWRQAYTSAADQHPAGATAFAKNTYHSIGLEDTSAWQILWSDPTNVFAAFSDISGIRSTDGGNGWSFNYTGHAANTMYRAFIHPVSKIIYAATSDIHDLYQSTRLADYPLDDGDSNGKIIYSADKGATWQTLHTFNHPVFWLCPDPNDTNTIYASVVSSASGGVYVCTNISAGASSSWSKLPNPPRTEGHPACLNVLNDGKVVATYSGHRNPAFTASSGVFAYDPIQHIWSDVSDPGMLYWTKDLIVDPADPSQNTWYVCVFSGWGGPPDGLGGLYRTADRGAHWSKINPLDRVTSLTFNPANYNEAYLTTETSGLWFSTNSHAATPVFNLVTNYPFRQPERVYYNPYDLKEIWITSFGDGLMVGRSGAASQTLQFSTANVYASETNGSMSIGVTRTGGTNGAVSVNFATLNGSANSPANYPATNGVLNWPDGDASPRSITVPINNTPGYTGNLSFGLALSNPAGAVLGGNMATLTILDTDAPPARTNFNLIVASGTGTGFYVVGSTVHISAAAAPSGYGFDQWIGAPVANPLAANTTLVMPAADTTISALYKWLAPGTNYEVGSGLAYTNLSSVPWTNLMPNDVVNIHYQPGGYHEVILLSNSGATNAPITLHGIPDPVTGALPVIDGSNALAAASIPWRNPVFDGFGVLVISRDSSTTWGYIPSFITIENLHIQNADRATPYISNLAGQTNFSRFACGIYVEFAQHLTIRNCEINGCENGFFCNSKDSTPLELSADILIEHCRIHDNGYPGDYGVHNLYTEAMGITLQYNLIGPLRPGADGEQWKNRSAGTRICYNEWIMGAGPGTCMWLESPQGGQGVIDLDPGYKTNWCYGNVFYNPPTSGGITMIRFDALGIEGVPRSGTLYFYNNTVVNQADQSQRYGTAVFELPHHSEVLGFDIHDVLDCRNNIFANLPGTTNGTAGYFSLLASDDGTIVYGTNWISPGTLWYTLPYLATNFYGAFNGTNALLFGDASGKNNPGFVDGMRTNFHLLANSRCVDAAGPQSPQIAGTADDVSLEYLFPTSFQARAVNGLGLDLGAFEGNSTNVPPAGGYLQFSAPTASLAETAGGISLAVNRIGATNGTVTVNFATSDGTATAPANYAATNGTLTWAPGDTSTRMITIPVHYAAGYFGNLNFTVTLSGVTTNAALGTPAVATVTILETDLAAANYPPVADSQSLSVLENTPVAITLTGHDKDNDPLTFTVVRPPTHGSLSGTPPSLIFTPSNNATGPDGFIFYVSDGKTNSAPALVQMGINAPTNPAPVTAILSPANLSWFIAPTNIVISASASLPNGIRRVDFYAFTNLLGSSSNAPYVFTWTNPAPGQYPLCAKTLSNGGARTYSAPVNIAVVGASPLMTIQPVGAQHLLSWPQGVDGWLLQEATNVNGPWSLNNQPVVDTPAAHTAVVPNQDQKYFRLYLNQ